MMLFISSASKAQVSVNINIGSPPEWGPVGYTEVRYYYLPDVEAYYDIQTSMFIYFGDGVWLHRAYLPGRYRNYDLYGGYKVVMTDYYGDAPYSNFKEYKMKYKKGYHGPSQKTIGEKPGKNKSNPQKASQNQPKKQQNRKSSQKSQQKSSNNAKDSKGGKQANSSPKQGNNGGKGKKK